MLREEWDDTTRTYAAWDESGAVVDSRPYTQAENDQADAEADQNARLDSIEEQLRALTAIVMGTEDPGEGDTPVWSSPCPPNAVIRWPDAQGDRHRNVSGAWLVATPDEYPIGYVNLDVGQVDEWAAGVAYVVGDQVTYLGLTYQCAQAHQSQAGWTPPAVPALWTLVG